jgi:UDP-glucose 4-epimerase
LGRPTPLIRVPPGPGETAPALDFRVDKLAETGFKWRGDFAREIDATLRLCRDAFEKAA